MNIVKQISIMMFGSVAWLFCAALMPMHQNAGQAGVVAAASDLFVPSAFASEGEGRHEDADDEHEREHEDEHEHKAESSSAVCVSLAKLEESEREDADEERKEAEDERHDAETEHHDADVEHHDADVEHHDAHDAHVNGDDVAESDHEDKAKEHEDKAKEHEDKAKEHEDKAKEHDDDADEYEAKADEIKELSGNCEALVTDPDLGGSPKVEPGIWIPVPGSLKSSEINDYIAGKLAESGGAGKLIDTALAGSGSGSATPDSTMKSYREIQGK